jgi:hypothetical protein
MMGIVRPAKTSAASRQDPPGTDEELNADDLTGVAGEARAGD